MAKIDRRLLLVALKGANQSLVQKFLHSQSQRAAEMMKEEIQKLTGGLGLPPGMLPGG